MIDAVGRFVVFRGSRLLARGDWAQASAAAWRAIDGGAPDGVLVFDADTGRVADLDPRDAIVADTGAVAPPKRGRPRLGVVAREVTLLPRHWEWLNTQPGGASVALRRLVETARRDGANEGRSRSAREAAYRFMQAMAGDLPGFEEASRALFAGDRDRLNQEMEDWPADVRDQTMRYLEADDA